MRKKREMTVISFYDWTGWQRHLERMAQKGWMLDKISNFGVVYHRGDPRQVQYAVTYLPEASEFNPCPPESQQTFEEFCAEAGWVRAASWHQMQVFRAPVEAPPLETDALPQVDTLHRAMKKNFLPGHIVLAILALIQLVTRGFSYFSAPISELISNTSLLQWGMWLLLLLFCVGELANYFLWLRRARKLAWTEGTFCPSRSYPVLQRVLIWLIGIAVVLWLGSFPNPRLRVIGVVSLAAVACLMLVVSGARALFRRLGVSAGTSRVLTWVVSFVLTFALLFVLGAVVDRIDFSGTGETKCSAEDLPLVLQDFSETAGETYLYEAYESRSLLLKSTSGWQRRSWDQLSMYYDIYTTPFDWVMEACERDLLDDYDRINRYQSELAQYSFRPVDPTPWGAQEVWLLYKGETCQQKWIIRWEDRLVEFCCLSVGDGLTEEQMATITEKLNTP